MSFLIFAYRKLVLKRQISDKEYRQLTLSQQKQAMTDKIGLFQQSLTAAKNAIDALAENSLDGVQQNIFSKYPNGVIPQENLAEVSSQLQNAKYGTAMQRSIANSIFEDQSRRQLAPMHATEKQMDQEMANLESQLKQMRPELESVDKGESDAAKSEAPKFGLG